MKFALFLTVLAPALSSCVSVPAIPNAPGERITIEYSPGPFCGSCDTLKIVASSDGKAIWRHGFWQGHYTDRIEYRYRLRMTPAKFLELRATLAPFRPSGEKWLRVAGDRSDCAVEMTDAPERRVQWESVGVHDDLWIDLGCDPEKNAKLFETLETIPALVGLKPDFDTGAWVASTRIR